MGLLRGTRFPETGRRDQKFVGRPSAANDLEIVAAAGSHVRDVRGKTYIDWQMGWSVGNLGWNPPDIVARVKAYEGPTYVAPGMLYEPWADLAEQLVDLAPGKLAKAFRCVGGTEAVELALQMAMVATGRHKIVSVEGAYHGNSFAAKTLGEPLDDRRGAHLAGWKKLAPPLDERALDRLRTLLQDQDVAAFIIEPTILNLAVLIPDSAFMRGLVDLCHDHGTLVIADEVGTGFGRTGTLFACENYELEPDILTLAKSIGSGVAPIATTLATNEVAKQLHHGELDFYSTFGWHPLGVEAALGTLEYWREHRGVLLQNIAERSAELRHQLSIMDFASQNVELRIQGLAVGIDVHDEDYATQIERECRAHGLLLFADGESLVLFPALTIDHDTLAEGLAIFAQAARQ